MRRDTILVSVLVCVAAISAVLMFFVIRQIISLTKRSGVFVLSIFRLTEFVYQLSFGEKICHTGMHIFRTVRSIDEYAFTHNTTPGLNKGQSRHWDIAHNWR